MTRQLKNGNSRRTAADRLEQGSRGRMPVVTTEHSLLTSSWTADVETVETAIGRFTTDRSIANDCQVMLFEIAGDAQLHVNVIHERPRTAVRGWAGPGRLPAGCVYNRRFGDTPPNEIIRHIRDMVFA